MQALILKVPPLYNKGTQHNFEKIIFSKAQLTFVYQRCQSDSEWHVDAVHHHLSRSQVSQSSQATRGDIIILCNIEDLARDGVSDSFLLSLKRAHYFFVIFTKKCALE